MVAAIIIGAIIVLAAFLIIWYLISNEFYKVAVAKGYPQKKYFWLTFFLRIVGILLIIALPDRGNSTAQIEAQMVDELPDL